MSIPDETVAWLMDGDPVIRWQTMRDLMGEPESAWQAERGESVLRGWGAQYLKCLRPDGAWPPGRWTMRSSTLRQISLLTRT